MSARMAAVQQAANALHLALYDGGGISLFPRQVQGSIYRCMNKVQRSFTRIQTMWTVSGVELFPDERWCNTSISFLNIVASNNRYLNEAQGRRLLRPLRLVATALDNVAASLENGTAIHQVNAPVELNQSTLNAELSQAEQEALVARANLGQANFHPRQFSLSKAPYEPISRRERQAMSAI